MYDDMFDTFVNPALITGRSRGADYALYGKIEIAKAMCWM